MVGPVQWHRANRASAGEQRGSKSTLSTDEEYVNEARDMLSFKDCEWLLRGATLTHVMRLGARIFSSSAPSASAYQLSRQVTRIDAFISHNWVTARWRKYVALVVHFNVEGAMCMTLLVVAVISAIQVMGFLPEVTLPWASHPRGVCVKLLAPAVFLTSLFTGRDVFWLLGGTRAVMGPMVFADRISIDQTNQVTISRGVKKLGATLQHSTSIVAVYTNVYLHKLWTVYEMASFLILHSRQGLYIIPGATPAILLAGVAVGGLMMAATTLIEATTGFEWTLECSIFSVPYLYCLALRHIAIQQAEIRARLVTFSVHHARCSVEDDRQAIYRNITALMHWAGKVDPETTEERALLQFDALVREELPEALASSVGRAGIRYVHAVAIGFCYTVGYQVDKLAGIRHGLPRTAFVFEPGFVCVASFTIVPLYIYVASRLGCRFMHLKGCREKAYLALVHATALVASLSIYFGATILRSWCLVSVGRLVIVMFFFTLVVACTLALVAKFGR